MLKDHIREKLEKCFHFTLTEDQQEAISALSEFVSCPKKRNLLLLKGYAGTGKTTLIGGFVQILKQFKINAVLLAPTGRAAKVLSQYTRQIAFTIHKKIYRQKSLADAEAVFVKDRNMSADTVFIVDEASMIPDYSSDASIFGSGCLLDDLIEYVYMGRNCSLILIGDSAQLPPVGLDVSPALNGEHLCSSYHLNAKTIILRQVVRQSQKSGILSNATELRLMLSDNKNGFPALKTKNYPDIFRIGGEDLIEELSSSYSKHGLEESIVINRSNKRANQFNQGIRNAVLFRDEEISVGDLLMVVKNNYHWSETVDGMDFIANGDIVEIVKKKKYIERYGFRYVEVSLRFPDYRDMELDVMIMLDVLNLESASLDYETNKKLFFAIAEDYADVKTKKERYKKVRNDPFFNALQVKFAYAVTCHKAQGGQWKSVFVDQGYVRNDLLDREYYRWLYTALTRATHQLYLVNFKDDFFVND